MRFRAQKSTFLEYGRAIYRWKRILKLISDFEHFGGWGIILAPFDPFLTLISIFWTYSRVIYRWKRILKLISNFEHFGGWALILATFDPFLAPF